MKLQVACKLRRPDFSLPIAHDCDKLANRNAKANAADLQGLAFSKLPITHQAIPVLALPQSGKMDGH